LATIILYIILMLIGNKSNKDLFKNLLKNLIPSDIMVYVEPFGGEFGLYERLEPKPSIAIYNDINHELYYQVSEKYKNDKNVQCFNKDYKEIILQYDNVDTFFYIDAPYLYNEKYYKNHDFLKIENHIELSKILKNIKGRFLISYQDKELIRELYFDYNFYKYGGQNFISKPEIAITNYEIHNR